MVAEVIDNTTSRGRTLRFLYDGPYEEFKATLYGLGETPLPRFIKRDVILKIKNVTKLFLPNTKEPLQHQLQVCILAGAVETLRNKRN